MKLGMNLLLWGTDINESLFPVLDEIKTLGFDAVEVPIFNLNPHDWHFNGIKTEGFNFVKDREKRFVDVCSPQQ